jgi:hypothetical protein
MVERSCKSSADQKIELLIFEKLRNAFRANVFTDTCVNDFDGTMTNRAANDADAVPIRAKFISEQAQEFRALRGQGERYRNCCHVEESENISDYFNSQVEII